MDALYLFEACLQGRLQHVPRRPHDRERSSLISSGNIFIYEEHASGIKRWTDGVPWSPSRILGNFLIYRELDKPFPAGEKKRAMKKKENGVTKATSNQRSNSIGHSGMMAGVNSALQSSATTSSSSTPYDNPHSATNDLERALVGSLVDSYQFRQDGLIKKTISSTFHGITHHLVSYYTIDDVKTGRLMTPSQTDLKMYTPRSEIIQSSNFRAPVDDSEIFLVPADDGRQYAEAAIYPVHGSYGRSMSVGGISTPQFAWNPQSSYLSTPSYQVHQSPHSLNMPSSTYAPVSTSTYSTYDPTPSSHNQYVPNRQFQMPSTSMPSGLRRHHSVFETQTATSPSPYRASSMQGSQLNNGTGILPSNGDVPHSMASNPFSSTNGVFNSQGSTGNSSQHMGFDSGSSMRNGTSYSHGSHHQASSSFDGLPPSNTGTSGAVQTTSDYGSSIATTDGAPDFQSGSDGPTSDDMLPPTGGSSSWGNTSFSQYQH